MKGCDFVLLRRHRKEVKEKKVQDKEEKTVDVKKEIKKSTINKK